MLNHLSIKNNNYNSSISMLRQRTHLEAIKDFIHFFLNLESSEKYKKVMHVRNIFVSK